MENLDEALTLLDDTDGASSGSMGMQDLIYGTASNGDVEAEKILWKKQFTA